MIDLVKAEAQAAQWGLISAPGWNCGSDSLAMSMSSAMSKLTISSTKSAVDNEIKCVQGELEKLSHKSIPEKRK